MSWIDLNSWELIDQKQIVEESVGERDPKKADAQEAGSALSIRTLVKPVDFYAYLVGRFGEPNGKQTLLLNLPLEGTPTPDSGNLIHWDFELKSGETRVLITGLTREIHIFVSIPVSDEEWITFIRELKIDFGKYAKAKSAVQSRFEKWLVFANPFVAIADACAGCHERITEAQKIGFSFESMGSNGLDDKTYQDQLETASARANRIYADCLQLRLLTPILGEAFINMLTSLLAKPKVKEDAKRWLDYRKSSFHTKLEKLSTDCQGFVDEIDNNSEIYKAFMRIRGKRNDILHANVLPEQNKLETIFFDGNVPLYAEAGDIFQKFWERYEAWVDPQGAIQDYENVHLFFIEIQNCLEPKIGFELRTILDEPFPGYDQSRKRFGKLWPDHIAHFTTDPNFIRYDDQLSRD